MKVGGIVGGRTVWDCTEGAGPVEMQINTSFPPGC